MVIFTNCNVVQEKSILKTNVMVNDGKICGLSDQVNGTSEIIDCGGRLIAPGLIDIHIHGVEGFDSLDTSKDSIIEISTRLAKRGITSFVPTIMTSDPSVMKNAIKNISDAMSGIKEGAEILGIHLEGPYISNKALGAHKLEYVENPSIQGYKNLVGAFEKIIRIVTIAPEKAEALELIRYLSSTGVICSIGHTTATYEEAMNGIKNGVSHSTHLYNCMSGLNHRNPGTVGAVFSSDIYAELVGDGIMISSVAFDIACKQKGLDKIVLVSDAIGLANLKDGRYVYNDEYVNVVNGIAKKEDGTIVGSVCTIDRTAKNLIHNSHLNILDLVRISSMNPARLLGVDNKKGAIKPGYDADIILLTPNYEIERVYIGGQQVQM